MDNTMTYFLILFVGETVDEPVENVDEFVLTVGHAELHDPVQQVHQVRREITVERWYGAFKVVAASHRINLRQQNLHKCTSAVHTAVTARGNGYCMRHVWSAGHCLGRRLSTWLMIAASCPTAPGALCGQPMFQFAWCHTHSAVMATELLQRLVLVCGTLFLSSCVIRTSPMDCSDDGWRDTFSWMHEHGALWPPICGALEKHLLTYLLTFPVTSSTLALERVSNATSSHCKTGNVATPSAIRARKEYKRRRQRSRGEKIRRAEEWEVNGKGMERQRRKGKERSKLMMTAVHVL